MQFLVFNWRRRMFLLLAPALFTGCALEPWNLSTVSRRRDFEIRTPRELFERPESTTNRLVYLEPVAGLLDYAYADPRHSLEITLPVNRDRTVTVAGKRAGEGPQLRLLNFRRLPRSVRLKDSVGAPKIGASVVIPQRNLADEQQFTLLLGVTFDSTFARPQHSLKTELPATLQAVAIYDYGRDLIVTEWTRQLESEPRVPAEKPPVDDTP